MSVLGYPTSSGQMSNRLKSILADDDYATLVAVDDDHVVGFIGTRIGPVFEYDAPYGQILALAVSPDYQRRGIGGVLMRAAESMLIARGASVLGLTSGNHRTTAHAFYEQHGYTFTGRRY